MNWIRDRYEADVSVIIVSYNTCDVVERALEALLRSGQESRVEVVVVDNDSRDGTAEMIQTKFPSVVLAANRVNLGHSGGCNQGMRLARGRHLFCLNSDTVMRTGSIDTLSRYLDQHPQVGAVTGKLLNMDGTIQGAIKTFPTPAAALFGRYSLLTRLFPQNRWSRRYLAYLDQDFSRPFPCDSVSAAAIMVRREAIERAGPFDERFFLYWNDVDWCKAIWTAGFEIHCVPEAIIVHDQHRGGTRAGFKRLVTSAIDFHKGAYRYYRKWQTRGAWDPRNLAAFALLSVRALAVIITEGVRWLFGLEVREMSGRKESVP